MITFIGIDPGDRWSGIATLQVKKRRDSAVLRLGSFVVDGKDDIYRSIPFLSSIITESETVELAVESFQQRGVGHQAWKIPTTAKLIGAIEWMALGFDVPTHFYAPGKAREHLEAFKMSDLLSEWGDAWPAGEWNHAWSAWRILTILLLRHNGAWLGALHKLWEDRVPTRLIKIEELEGRIAAAPYLQGSLPASDAETPYELIP